MIGKWLREPFVHFILIGGLVFVLYELTAKTPEQDRGLNIDISAADIDELRQQWSRQTGEEPGPATLDDLVESKIYQEVMLREAKRLGLDRNDTIVRRRLVQKMEFLSANPGRLEIPGEDALLDYFESNRDRYRVPEKRTFTHVYFSRDRRGEAMLSDANVQLEQLQDKRPHTRVPGQGDNFILQYDYKQQGERQVARVFGDKFAKQLFQLAAETWEGPLLSEYGAHLVRVHSITESYIPALNDIASRVLDDLMQERLAELKDRTYAEMRARYQVNVEK